MKIIDKRPKAPTALRIDQTTPGSVYFYSVADAYVLRIRNTVNDDVFVELENGTLWHGEDGMLFEVDVEVAIR